MSKASIDALAAQAARSWMDSISVPEMAATQIAARRAEATRNVRPANRLWPRLAIAIAVLVAGVLFAPPVAHSIAGAATNLIKRVEFFVAGPGSQRLVRGTAVALAKARENALFVQPRGIPPGFELVSLMQGPAARPALSLIYADDLGRRFSILEMRAHSRHAGCRVIQWKRSAQYPTPPLSGNRLPPKTAVPKGFRDVPCLAWKAGNTDLILANLGRGLTPEQMRAIARATR